MPAYRMTTTVSSDSLLARALAGDAYLLFDGAMGTMLQKSGLEAGELPELLCLTAPEVVGDIHRAYVEAGCDVVTTNTFGANALKLAGRADVAEIFTSAVDIARRSGASYVAADIGPLGTLLKPLGTLDPDEAFELFSEQAQAAALAGADLIVIETMGDLLEAKTALLAAHEACDLPVLVTMTFGADGNTFLGTSPEICAMTLSALGADAIGINCSLGPVELRPLIERMVPFARAPLMVQANAGLPRAEGDRTVYDIDAEHYAEAVTGLLDSGVTVIGGCCGTDPDYIRRMRALIDVRTPHRSSPSDAFCICSARRALVLPRDSSDIAVIGERINPTGKRRLKEALRSGDLDHAVGEALDQAELGVDALDVNVGLPEIDEIQMLSDVMEHIQAVCDLPLQVDSTDPAALERAVRRYAGKPLINSVNGTRESLDAILPLAAKYGCAVVALTLDENGIPETADERFAIAQRIVDEAAAYSIPPCDIAVDCLTLAASTDQAQVPEILHAIGRVKSELGVKTILGVSNISFGLPQRELVNAVFMASAFGAGLDLAIMDPRSARMRDVVAAQRVLNGQDERARSFIEHYADEISPYEIAAGGASGASSRATEGASDTCPTASSSELSDDPAERARHYILTGRKAPMPEVTRELLAVYEPLDVIDDFFIPVLDEVGAKFERGEFFLPQLMASAEAVKAGFDTVKAAAPASAAADKGDIVLATVKGDIHDIGKNIVKMLLENYGYHVYDLGRDVAPEAVLECVLDNGVHLVGLSALMTTTVRSMEETIRLLHEKAPDCKIMVGGAVLTPEYAKMVGADYYARDAAESARIAEGFFGTFAQN